MGTERFAVHAIGIVQKQFGNVVNAKRHISRGQSVGHSGRFAVGIERVARSEFHPFDIKLENIMISQDNVCKLGDFGLVMDLNQVSVCVIWMHRPVH